ncbi:MAG: SUMF1/EgtB/PvdO family nonheme iron enzyme [Muribaculaceae bacterium]|nr:SUMF1/EgtB/PvdO family nonheme iron enzyme [Muribaculaceae bacterium]
MKKSLLLLMLVPILTLLACGKDDDEPTSGSDAVQTFTVNGVSFKMIKVEGGTFTMGDKDDNIEAFNSRPAHQVTLSTFLIGQTEVTQELWEAVLDRKPSVDRGDKQPVESVNYYDCMNFLMKLNELTGMHFRLPFEAEWEYAARGGNLSKGFLYSGSDDLLQVGWFYDNSGNPVPRHKPVASKAPNELGIYDMSGNVFEWCMDWLGDYSSEPQANPTGPNSGTKRVIRGGSYNSNEVLCRVTSRWYEYPNIRNINMGLRLVLNYSPQ